MTDQSKVRTCLWFNGQAEEAATFYVSLLPGSHIETMSRPIPDQPVLVVEFTLAGAPYMILNGGAIEGSPKMSHSAAASISVLTENQAETDRLWAALTREGGEAGRCGWLKDRYGVSWQIVPAVLPRLLNSEDRTAAARTHQAMMAMGKIEIAALEAAFAGNKEARTQ